MSQKKALPKAIAALLSSTTLLNSAAVGPGMDTDLSEPFFPPSFPRPPSSPPPLPCLRDRRRCPQTVWDLGWLKELDWEKGLGWPRVLEWEWACHCCLSCRL